MWFDDAVLVDKIFHLWFYISAERPECVQSGQIQQHLQHYLFSVVLCGVLVEL